MPDSSDRFATIVLWKGEPYKLSPSIFLSPKQQDPPVKHAVVLKLGGEYVLVRDTVQLCATNKNSPIVLDSEVNKEIVHEVELEQGKLGKITFPP